MGPLIEIPALPADIAYDQWCIVEGHFRDYDHAYQGPSGEVVSSPYYPYGYEDDRITPKRIPCFVIGVNSPAAHPAELRPYDTALVIIVCPVPEEEEALTCMVQRGYTISVFPKKTMNTAVEYRGSSRPDIFKGHAEFVCTVM